jgi:hypothetical protein
VIVSSVPRGLPTGSKAELRGRDGWAGNDLPSGFARERDRILRFLAERGIATPIWITTDVHIAEVFVHRPLPERADFRVIEAISGPLNAGLGIEQPPDPTLHSEVRFVHAAPANPPLARWDDALRYFNFGALEVAADGRLTVRIVGVDGASSSRELRAEPKHLTWERRSHRRSGSRHELPVALAEPSVRWVLLSGLDRVPIVLRVRLAGGEPTSRRSGRIASTRCRRSTRSTVSALHRGLH